MSGQYRFMLATFTTGQLIAELNLIGVTGERLLGGRGGFSARMSLVEMTNGQRIRLLEDTTPGKSSVVIIRDGEALGEWVIWKRTRMNDNSPIELTGREFISYLDHRLVGAGTFAQVEQLDIAKWMFDNAIAGAGPSKYGKVTASVATYQPSGVKRDRTYLTAEAFAGQRLEELSAVIDGFDYYVDTAVDNSGTRPVAVRQLMLYYPRAGTDRGLSLEASGLWDQGGAIISTGLAEDGELLAGEAWAIGGTYDNAGVDTQLLASASNYGMMTNDMYPYLQASGSFTSVVIPATLKGHAQALLTAHQRAEIPAPLTIRYNADYPSPSAFRLGDRFTITIEPSINFPSGATIRVRLVGWTIRPPEQGPETLTLQVAAEG